MSEKKEDKKDDIEKLDELAGDKSDEQVNDNDVKELAEMSGEPADDDIDFDDDPHKFYTEFVSTVNTAFKETGAKSFDQYIRSLNVHVHFDGNSTKFTTYVNGKEVDAEEYIMKHHDVFSLLGDVLKALIMRAYDENKGAEERKRIEKEAKRRVREILGGSS